MFIPSACLKSSVRGALHAEGRLGSYPPGKLKQAPQDNFFCCISAVWLSKKK
ncbi:hypothetical protein HMPREF9446_02142 [Bacteroides fluxus YIT 12057]|uniref:Uncharacterized protein n=1 Tax=Bacteroides fluxus YIT 12057 TaxID=763034 RepID=F3PTT6_9BACE|nr:hypothetical protein HMPREF9446_02142 [Bacteroides fluxus YIT 12057]